MQLGNQPCLVCLVTNVTFSAFIAPYLVIYRFVVFILANFESTFESIASFNIIYFIRIVLSLILFVACTILHACSRVDQKLALFF